jgi:hypothetical protein
MTARETLELLAYIESLKADLERTRFFAWALTAILFATILSITVVK